MHIRVGPPGSDHPIMNKKNIYIILAVVDSCIQSISVVAFLSVVCRRYLDPKKEQNQDQGYFMTPNQDILPLVGSIIRWGWISL
mmetsp:Transcript_108473/g.221496  ORF Transcript_108473/g.221496 Transcript_108473/m.221496 type:complete len:84 (-) Transcript_108473:1436-1687(-)